MRTLTKGLAAGAVGLAVLVPTGLALADDGDDTAPTPACTADQRQERQETCDRLRVEILDDLHDEGVTDPDLVRDRLQTRLHDAMEHEYGDMPGPRAHTPGAGGQHHSGPNDGAGHQHGH